jgi:hypothetical protein
MQPAFTSPAHTHVFGARKPFKGAPLNVCAWTGRSALSRVTTTSRPALATAGAGKTRVSEMRDFACRIALARPARPRMKPRHAGPDIG